MLSINDEKVSLVCSVSKDLLENYNAKKIVIQIVEFWVEKGGGGREDMAQGGALLSKKLIVLKFIERVNINFPSLSSKL